MATFFALFMLCLFGVVTLNVERIALGWLVPASGKSTWVNKTRVNAKLRTVTTWDGDLVDWDWATYWECVVDQKVKDSLYRRMKTMKNRAAKQRRRDRKYIENFYSCTFNAPLFPPTPEAIDWSLEIQADLAMDEYLQDTYHNNEPRGRMANKSSRRYEKARDSRKTRERNRVRRMKYFC